MSDKTSTRMTACAPDGEGVGRLVSWGAGAALASPFVALFGVAVGVSIYADDVSQVAGSGRFTVATASALVALILLSLGLVGLYLQQQHAFGPFGTATFVLALVGTVLAVGGAWNQVFTVPYLANKAPTVLDQETSGSLLAGFFLSFALLSVGWAMFAIATRRAAVLSRRGSMVLLVGALIAFLPAPSAARLLVLTLGAALLARGTVSRSVRLGPAGLAAAAGLLIAGCGGEDRLSNEETATRLNKLFASTSRQVQQQFHPVFRQLEGLTHDRPIPDRMATQLKQATNGVTRALRRAADEAANLQPPDHAEDELNLLVNAAREQANALEQLGQQPNVTVGDLATAVEPPADELRRLRAAGIPVQSRAR